MVSEQGFYKQVFGAGEECPPLTEITEGIERGDPKFTKHVGECPHCAVELEMYRAFMAAEGVENANVRWITRRLTNPARPAKLGFWQITKALLRPRPMLVGASALAAIVMVVSIGLQQRAGIGTLPAVRDTVERAQSVELVAPRGDIAGAPEQFRWTPVASAVKYRVQLLEVDKTVLWSDSTTSAAVSVSAAIQSRALPGKRLLWTVEALDAGGRVIASGTQDFRRALRPSR